MCIRDRYITFPLLKPLIIVAVLFRTIDAFRVFDTIFVLTGGGPGHFSETLNLLTYREAFRFMHISYASTIAIIMLIVLIAISSVTIKFFKGLEI